MKRSAEQIGAAGKTMALSLIGIWPVGLFVGLSGFGGAVVSSALGTSIIASPLIVFWAWCYTEPPVSNKLKLRWKDRLRVLFTGTV